MKQLQFFMLFLLICWSMGISSRMLYEYITAWKTDQNILVVPNRFDFFFDWGTLFFLSFVNFCFLMDRRQLKDEKTAVKHK